RHRATGPLDLPSVGDWVVVIFASDGHAVVVIHVFVRRTQFLRKVVGRRTEVQVLAANINHVAVVTSPNDDFNPNRLERYRTAIRQGGANVLFVLNKADLRNDLDGYLEAFAKIDPSATVLVTRALEGQGVDALRSYCATGETLALVGSSGVGKSTLVNAMLGRPVQRVGKTRETDGRGRHVTSHRELFLLEDGGLLMDSPGMRELQVWSSDPQQDTFWDIASLANSCRFRDCTHQHEPGCAVQRAVDTGELDAQRLEAFHRLQQENLQLEERRQDAISSKSKHLSFHRSLKNDDEQDG
ncbi:MAG TPA: ribosome small subunit-dependent GTPase A, partial [Polyangiaceae bacterium]|nr:ribosome small subunit-dependent GTPase A [Polyangiaceae bacterium]